MSNPPGWVKQCKTSASYSEVNIMPAVAAGVVAAGDINSQPAQTGGLSASAPATWSYIWFILAFVYLIGIYYGMIRVHSR